MNVVSSERSRSGDAAARCSCRKRAGSILGLAIAWNSSNLSGNSDRRITRWPPHVYTSPPQRACRTPSCWTQLEGLGVGLQAEALLAEQIAHGVRADSMPLPGEF